MSAANVLWLRARAVGRRAVPAGRWRRPGAVGTVRRPAASTSSRFEYLATSLAPRARGGRDASPRAHLRRRRPPRGSRGDRAAARHDLGGRRAEARRMVHRPARGCRSGASPRRRAGRRRGRARAGATSSIANRRVRVTGSSLHFRRPSAEDRLRNAVTPGPLRLGAEAGHLTYPELAAAIERAVTALLRDRGEPAGPDARRRRGGRRAGLVGHPAAAAWSGRGRIARRRRTASSRAGRR